MLHAMIIIFGFMLLGYFSQIKNETNQSLSRLCLYYLIPVLIFQSVITSALSIRTIGIFVVHFFITTLATYAFLTFILGKWIGWGGEPLKWNTLSSTLANVGYFGLAVIQFAIGENAVPYAAAVALAFNLYMAVFGFSQAGTSKNVSERYRLLLRNPYLYAIVVSLLWKWAGIQMPGVISGFLDMVVKTTLPITLLLTGAELRRNRFALSCFREAIQISAIKLFFPILLAWPLAFLLTDDPTERMVMILMFGMPTSLNLLLLAKENGKDTSAISMAILVTTIVSPFTLFGFMKLLAAG